jgi:predicted RNA-binding protein YlxR (DUF448 family)
VGRGHPPLRTCAGCRAQVPKGDLVRLVHTSDGGIELDPAGTAPGRGGYVHCATACLEAALARGGLARALRVGVGEDAASRLRALIDRMQERV